MMESQVRNNEGCHWWAGGFSACCFVAVAGGSMEGAQWRCCEVTCCEAAPNNGLCGGSWSWVTPHVCVCVCAREFTGWPCRCLLMEESFILIN